MKVQVLDSGPALSEEQVAQAERELGLCLPEEYRAFLLSHNGGHPLLDAFAIWGHPSGERSRVDYFLCLQAEDPFHLPDWVRRYRARIPSDLLPIAADMVGNLICLALSGTDQGRVLFWDHEGEAGIGRPPTRANIYFVAGSFRAFLESLRED